MGMDQHQLYILPVVYQSNMKRLFLEGAGGESGKRRFDEVYQSINSLVPSAEGFCAFQDAVVQHQYSYKITGNHWFVWRRVPN
jgi:hypothetical protein